MRALMLRVLVLAAVLGVTGCADGSGAEDAGPELATTNATDRDAGTTEVAFAEVITIEDRRYTPPDFFVGAERELRVVDSDDEAHTVTSFDGSFDVRVPPRGEVEFLTPEPGAYAYACRFHPEMGGEFEVR